MDTQDLKPYAGPGVGALLGVLAVRGLIPKDKRTGMAYLTGGATGAGLGYIGQRFVESNPVAVDTLAGKSQPQSPAQRKSQALKELKRSLMQNPDNAQFTPSERDAMRELGLLDDMVPLRGGAYNPGLAPTPRQMEGHTVAREGYTRAQLLKELGIDEAANAARMEQYQPSALGRVAEIIPRLGNKLIGRGTTGTPDTEPPSTSRAGRAAKAVGGAAVDSSAWAARKILGDY